MVQLYTILVDIALLRSHGFARHLSNVNFLGCLLGCRLGERHRQNTIVETGLDLIALEDKIDQY